MRPSWWSPAFGHGRAWLRDQGTGVLVAIDPRTLRAAIHTTGLPQEWSFRQGQVLITTGAVWVCLNEQLLIVDPESSVWRSVPVPLSGVIAMWTAVGDGVVGTDWPSDRLIRVSEDGSVRVVQLGGHLERLAYAARRLWVVDRADETLLSVDPDDLSVRARVRFDGGCIEALLPLGDPLGDGVLVSHDADLFRGDESGVWRIDPAGVRALVYRPIDLPDLVGDCWFSSNGKEFLAGCAPIVVATDGRRLWVGSDGHNDFQADPIGTITPIELATGRAGEPILLAGQVGDLGYAFGRLWRTGFVRSRQTTVLTVVDPTGAGYAEVDFTGLDLEPHRPRPEPPPPPDYQAELDGLIEELHHDLTTPWLATDPRTGERRPEGPAVHQYFRLLDLALDRDTPAVRVTFEWLVEPGLRFVYEHPFTIPPTASSIAGDVSVSIAGQICNALVYRAEREQHGDVVLLRLPSRPAPE